MNEIILQDLKNQIEDLNNKGCFGIEWLGITHPDDVGFKPLSDEGEVCWNLNNFLVAGNIHENPELLEAGVHE